MKVTLSRKQADCVATRLDALLLRRTEPVFFDASACSQVPTTMGPANPVIAGPKPASVPDNLWLLLTKRQLACLKRQLVALRPDQAGPIEIALDDEACRTLPP